jgi:RNA polymerase sigma-70 factor, ECF subfamily
MANSNLGEDFSDEAWGSFVEGLAAGQPWAYEEFWSRYGKRLEAVTAKHFPAGLHRRLEPEDIVQSTCRSFFTRMVDGRLSVADADGLWGLLCAITLNKTRMKQRFHLAKRRALNRESDPHSPSNASEPNFEPSGADSAPDEPMMFTEQLEQTMALLDPIEREVLQLKLEDFTHEEIAEKIHRSDRTIRRVVVRIQEKLRGTLHQ